MNQTSKKTAVILFNLGGPDSKDSIRPFLINFFMDKNIIRAPIFVRFFLSRLIAYKRSKKEAGDSYAELGDKSPLLANSNAQGAALENILNENAGHEFKVFICMRYWHPMADEVAKQVKSWGAEEIFLLPLYPQFSTTTTRSSFEEWDKAIDKIGMKCPTTRICCYPWAEGFIKASAQNILKTYHKAVEELGKAPRILLSAHGLPEKIIKEGDPYQWQCEQSAKKIIEGTGLENPDWQICYQSRVGPLKWIGPSTEEALEKAAKDNVSVLIYPHAFTQEHVETLVELDIEYREVAEHLDIQGYYRADTVGCSEAFIQGLADLVLENLRKNKTLSNTGKPLCPNQFGDCCMRSVK